jgi:hypothetical protein
MNKKEKPEQLSTTVKTSFFNILRRHSYTMRLNNNEVLELYQNAYLEKIEREKAEKKAEREKKEVKKE